MERRALPAPCRDGGGQGSLQLRLPHRQVPWRGPHVDRGGGEPIHRGGLGAFHSVNRHCFIPRFWRPCPFTGLLRGDPQPNGQAQRNGPAHRHPGQIFFTGRALGFTPSPPMFLFPRGPAGCGPLTWGQGEQGEACMELRVSPRGRRALCLDTKRCLELAPNHMVRGTFLPWGYS